MSTTHESWVKDGKGNVVAKDTTTHNDDGSSVTVHQTAFTGILGNQATEITSVTHNGLDGKSTDGPPLLFS